MPYYISKHNYIRDIIFVLMIYTRILLIYATYTCLCEHTLVYACV